MRVSMQTEDWFLKSPWKGITTIVPEPGIKASSENRGLGCSTGAERNAVHNGMLWGLVCDFSLCHLKRFS